MIRVDYIRDGLTEESHEGVWNLAKPVAGFSADEEKTPYFLRFLLSVDCDYLSNTIYAHAKFIT